MHSSFVALGDSFTEGLDDYTPAGAVLGWADRVAGHLAGRLARAAGPAVPPEALRYANLAVRGRLIGQVVAEQVPVAAAMGAELASFAAGTNDVLRRRFDLPAQAALVEQAAATLAASGARLVLFTGTDPSRRLPWAERLLPRIDALNEVVHAVAARHDAVLVDLHVEPVFDDPRLWSGDRLHLNSKGHRRVALAVLEALGASAGPDWRAPLPAAATPGSRSPAAQWRRARRDDLGWAREHLAPWVVRRIAGRSSGDLRAAKRPDLAAYEPPVGDDAPEAGQAEADQPDADQAEVALADSRLGATDPGRR